MTVVVSAMALLGLAGEVAWAQYGTLSQEDRVRFTVKSPYERFADGRPVAGSNESAQGAGTIQGVR
jgi:hypothetical protein